MGVDWLVSGDERKRRYPADNKLTEWLRVGFSIKAFGEPLGYTGTHIIRFEKNVVIPDERVIQNIG